MTPEYASPEQVRGEVVTTATDVYSLGVLLYELLTGRRPYQLTSRTPAEIARVVCHSVPERPSTAVTRTWSGTIDPEAITTAAEASQMPAGNPERPKVIDPQRLRRRLAGDLDNIVLKALSKEPARRYASVDQFSEDIRRHLSGLPVTARKDTLGYRAAKFVGRNRTVVAAAALIVVALIAGIVGTSWQALAARRERARAEQRFEDVRQLANAALLEIHDAIRDLPGSTPARRLLVSKGLEYLDRLARDAGDRPDLQRELAGAYIKVGDVQGRPLNPNLGDSAGALASYRKAVGIYESIGAAASADPGLRRELALASQRLSEILSATGDTREALVQARRSLELLQQSTRAARRARASQPPTLAASWRPATRASAICCRPRAIRQARSTIAGGLSRSWKLSRQSHRRRGDDSPAGCGPFEARKPVGQPQLSQRRRSRGALQELERAAAVFEKPCPHIPPMPSSGATWRLPTATSPTC